MNNFRFSTTRAEGSVQKRNVGRGISLSPLEKYFFTSLEFSIIYQLPTCKASGFPYPDDVMKCLPSRQTFIFFVCFGYQKINTTLAACSRCGVHFNKDGCHYNKAGPIAPGPLPFYSAGDNGCQHIKIQLVQEK